jgi:hypothetical protein
MKKVILLIAVILLSAAGLVHAQEGELTGTVDVTYLSKYIWRGFDIYDDKSAIQPSIDLDLYGTGFGICVMGHRANSGEYENGERWDYTLYYGNSLYEGEDYETLYRLAYVYYNYPDMSSHATDSTVLQELQMVLSWPKICPAGIVPSYVLVKLWPSNSGSAVGSKAVLPGTTTPSTGTASGFAHIFMLDYGMSIEGLLPEIPEQILNLHAEVIYNDGVGPNGANVDQDWSNAVFGVSTNFDLGNNLTFTPGIYHQITLDDSVNDDKDETWVSLSMKYAF